MRLTLVALICLAGCSKKGATEVPPVASPPPVAPTTLAPGSELGVFDRLALEASNKDQADPPTQKVILALKRAGLTLAPEQQHLGAPLGASYCSGVDVAEHLTVTICEYASADAATQGAEASRKNFAAIAHRTVQAQRATTLTVIESPADASSAEAAKKAFAAFSAL